MTPRLSLAMDYVAGPNLAARTGHQPMSPQRAANLAKTVAEAIHYAHERGVLHRALNADGTAAVWDAASAKQVASWEREEENARQSAARFQRERLETAQRQSAARARDPGAIRQW